MRQRPRVGDAGLTVGLSRGTFYFTWEPWTLAPSFTLSGTHCMEVKDFLS